MNHWSKHVLLVALAGFVLTATAAAQRKTVAPQQSDRPLLGPQLGVGTDHFKLFIGGQFAYPVAKQFDVYPSLQIYFPGSGVSAWGLYATGRWWAPLSMPNAGLYVGGGLNYTHTSAAGFGHGSAALALLGGWDFKAVKVRPFAELRAVVGGDYDRIDIGGGINFKL